MSHSSEPPSPYDRQYNFTNFQASNPTTPLPGQKVDQELNAARESINETIHRLGEIQADDGKVRNSALNLGTIAEAVEDLLTAAPVQAVEAAGASQVAAVEAAGTAQVAAVDSAGFINLSNLEAVINSQAAVDAINAASDAQNHASNAAMSVTEAQTAQTAAQQYANLASASQISASNFASTASGAAGAAQAAAIAASNSANQAAYEAGEANQSQLDAEASKMAALAAKASAEAAAAQAQSIVSNASSQIATDVQPYLDAAAGSANAASVSASAAQASAANASNSASNAATSASNASSSASSASASATSAAASAAAAQTFNPANFAALAGAAFSGDVSTTGRMGIGGGVAVNPAHKLAIYNGNVVFSAGYGIAFGDGTTLTSGNPSAHTHVIGDVTGLQSALNAKANLSGATFTGKITGAVVSGVAGVNIGTGGTDSASTTPGDIWVATTSLNFRDAAGSWRQCLTSSSTGVIDVNNNTTPALRITQRGTANAFVVEDSTTPDSTPFVIDANGRVGIGVTPDATAALKVDAGGIRFNDGTLQTTAATSVAWGSITGSITSQSDLTTALGLKANLSFENSRPSSSLQASDVSSIKDAYFRNVTATSEAIVSPYDGAGSLKFTDYSPVSDGKQIIFNEGPDFALTSTNAAWYLTLRTQNGGSVTGDGTINELSAFIYSFFPSSLGLIIEGNIGSSSVAYLISSSPLTLGKPATYPSSTGSPVAFVEGIPTYLHEYGRVSGAVEGSVATFSSIDPYGITWSKPWQSEGYVLNATFNTQLAFCAKTNASNSYSGKQTFAASTTSLSSIRIPLGSAPSSPIDGDVWTTTSGLFLRLNSTTVQFPTLSGANTFTGATTFTAANLSFGTATTGGTVNVASGITTTGINKAVNIGVGGASGSTTVITIGSTNGTTTTINGTTTIPTGNRLNVGHSAASAGLRVTPVASGISAPVDGDVFHNSTAGVQQIIGMANGIQGCMTAVRAFVNFNGTGTVAMRSNFNVSSITDNGVGDYTVNFTNAIIDANYSTFITAKRGSLNEALSGAVNGTGGALTTSVRIVTGAGSFSPTDGDIVSVAIMR